MALLSHRSSIKIVLSWAVIVVGVHR